MLTSVPQAFWQASPPANPSCQPLHASVQCNFIFFSPCIGKLSPHKLQEKFVVTLINRINSVISKVNTKICVPLLLVRFFFSTWHKLESSAKREPQLRKNPPSDWSVDIGLWDFFLLITNEGEPRALWVIPRICSSGLYKKSGWASQWAALLCGLSFSSCLESCPNFP